MRLSRKILSAGLLALALGAGGISAGFAGDDEDYLNLPSDAKTTPVTPFALPSDKVPDSVPGTPKHDNWFLSFASSTGSPARVDLPVTACSYYLAIKAVTACGPNGELINPITFDKWKQFVKLGKHALNGQKEDVAHFINQVDLNLTRDHHLISYGPNQLAGYVCNHAGSAPTAADPTGLFPPQSEIDLLIKDIKRNKHLIACVAMEFSAEVEYTGAAQAGKPFTKFWIFGADGALLSTVDLDGRGQKGVPHVCTACHGGPFNTETFNGVTGTIEFDAKKAPNGDLGAHFLPFDMANFAFSSKRSQAEREEAIFRMNLNVFNTENTLWSVVQSGPNAGFITPGTYASASIAQLINGWYGFNVKASNVAPHFDRQFVPSHSWGFDSNHQNAYLNTVSHSCRTCHVAMENYPFEVDSSLFTNPASLVQSLVCQKNQYIMPNSKVTFDRFWLSANPSVPGQPAGPAGGQPNYLSFVTGQPCNAP